MLGNMDKMLSGHYFSPDRPKITKGLVVDSGGRFVMKSNKI